MRKLFISIMICLVFILSGAANVLAKPLEIVSELDFGKIKIENNAPVAFKSVNLQVNHNTKWILRLWRTNSSPDKLSIIFNDPKELNGTPLMVITSEKSKSFGLPFKLEPEILAGLKTITLKLALYQEDGTEIDTQDLKLKFEIPAIVRLSISPTNHDIKTAPGEPAIRSQVSFSVFATCAWEIRMTLQDSDNLVENPNQLFQWRIGSGEWNRVEKSQVILRGGPSGSEQSQLSLSQEFSFQPGWKINPKSYLLIFTYEIVATQ